VPTRGPRLIVAVVGLRMVWCDLDSNGGEARKGIVLAHDLTGVRREY